MTRAICGIGRFHTYLVCDRESRPTLGVSFSSEQLPEASQRSVAMDAVSSQQTPFTQHTFGHMVSYATRKHLTKLNARTALPLQRLHSMLHPPWRAPRKSKFGKNQFIATHEPFTSCMYLFNRSV